MKVVKIRHAFVKLQRKVFTKVSLCLQINENKTPPFGFQFNVSLAKCTKQQLKENKLINQTELLLQIIDR